jgi:hypothetical protein
MKKIILPAFAIIAFTLASNAQFKVGIVGGTNRQSQRINVSKGNALFSNEHFRNYQVGLTSDLKMTRNLYLQTQLLYTRKSASLLSSTGAADATVKFNYIEMPVNVLYKWSLPFGKVFAGTGAVFSYGVSGKQEQAGQKKKLYSDIKTWKHEDLSLSFTAGLELNNGLFASINSQKGLLNVYRTDGISVKNKSVLVSIGYTIDWNVFKRKG